MGNSNSTGYEPSPATDYLFVQTKMVPELHQEWTIYTYPILLFLGIIGNGFLITAMLHREMRVTCFGVIMIAMGVIHSLKLVFELMFWVNMLYYNMYGLYMLESNSLEICLVLEFFKQFTTNGSCWIIVALVIERFMAQIGQELTWECGMTKIGIAAALSGVLTTRTFLVTKYLDNLGCVQSSYDVWLSNIIQPTVGIYVPVIAVTVLNGFIIYCRQWKLDEESKCMTNASIVLCFLFIILFIPKTVVAVIDMYQPSDLISILSYPCQMVWMVNFAIPFYICLICCPEMRHALGVLFGCKPKDETVKPVSYMMDAPRPVTVDIPEKDPISISSGVSMGSGKPPIDQDFIKMLQNRTENPET